MSNEKTRQEFENHPRFRGMDFQRSITHPEYYESPYANGAWDGYQAGIIVPSGNPPVNCRQRLVADGKPYPRSSCEACGQFAPNYQRCDSLLAAVKS